METDARLRIEISGAVQGVGFRPFVYRLATELGLGGFVLNDGRGVLVEVEGPKSSLQELLERVSSAPPPRAVVHDVQVAWIEAVGGEADPREPFGIRHSDRLGAKQTVVLPDVATCAACLAEIGDSGDRRHRYAFTNCTDCGPRFTIVESLPYDRPNTTMRRFVMCAECQAEYDEPLDRRFHAQPNACPACGPSLELRDSGGAVLASGDEALSAAAESVRSGGILAVKGLGGFHLIVDASDEGAVGRLRERKGRYEKPLALMAADLDQVRTLCDMPPEAEGVLLSPAAPIVLMPRRGDAAVAEGVAPANPYLGVMLPYTPLHHLLLGEVGRPVVATSGNLSDEPICIEERDAGRRLGDIAELFLVHDRPIARHADDSVVSIVAGEMQPIRRARGLAPLPLILRHGGPSVLAVGGHLKNTVALSVGDRVFLSQHVGDMETPEARSVFERVIRDFLDMYEARPLVVAHDLHPDYPSTRWIADAAGGSTDWGDALRGLRRTGVQHHHAHLASCLADNDEEEAALGVTWDGTGYGTDGTVWGGEFLLGDAAGFERVATLRGFRLPGGEAAVVEPRRTALAVLWELHGDSAFERDDLAAIRAFEADEKRLLRRMLEGGIQSPATTSAGRLFDAVAGLLGIRQRVSFEGQAAMGLEFVADPDVRDAYPLHVVSDGDMLRLDWGPTVEAVLEDSQRGTEAGIVSSRFHNALVEAIVAVAVEVGHQTVALTGGCFQNRLLTERTLTRLGQNGFRVLLHRRVPANDGGISLGQVAVATARLAREAGHGE